MLDTIKSYLVSLGFSVDKGSYNEATKAMDNAEKSVSSFAGSAVTKFAVAGAAVASFVAADSIGIAKFIGDLAQADLANEKLARQLWMSKDAAAAYNNTLKAMGVTLQDLYLSPELMHNFQQLNQEAKNLRPPQEFAEQMKTIRSIQFEFARMKLEATYALQWIGYYFVKYMEGPLKQIKLTLSDINSVITKTMPSWTKIIAQVMSWFARMGVTSVRVIQDLLRGFNDLGQGIPKNIKLIGAAIGALLVTINTGPIGMMIAALSGLLLLLDDFYTYKDGGESAFGGMWKQLDSFSADAGNIFDAIKGSINDIVNVVKEFFSALQDGGALENFKTAANDAFDVISELIKQETENIKNLYNELDKQGAFTELSKNIADITIAISELSKSLSGLVKYFSVLEESSKVITSIGDAVEKYLVRNFERLNLFLKASIEDIKTFAALLKGDFIGAGKGLSKATGGLLEAFTGAPIRETNNAIEALSNNPRTLKVLNDIFFGDKLTKIMGYFNRDSLAYTLPTTNNQNTNNNVNLNQTNNIYGSDPQRTADAAQNNMEQFYTRNMSGVVR